MNTESLFSTRRPETPTHVVALGKTKREKLPLYQGTIGMKIPAIPAMWTRNSGTRHTPCHIERSTNWRSKRGNVPRFQHRRARVAWHLQDCCVAARRVARSRGPRGSLLGAGPERSLWRVVCRCQTDLCACWLRTPQACLALLSPFTGCKAGTPPACALLSESSNRRSPCSIFELIIELLNARARESVFALTRQCTDFSKLLFRVRTSGEILASCDSKLRVPHALARSPLLAGHHLRVFRSVELPHSSSPAFASRVVRCSHKKPAWCSTSVRPRAPRRRA